MTTTLVKQAAYTAGDDESGMQPASSGSLIGNTETTDGASVAGQDIAGALAADYFEVETAA